MTGSTFLCATAATVVVLSLACSGVKIETGQTPEEAAVSSETRARAIRSDFARQMDSATPVGQVELLIDHVDNTAARYAAIGYDLVDEWRRGNEGRGQDVPADEFRRVVANSFEKDKPVITAYEDNLEYALNRVRTSGHYDSSYLDLLKSLADNYYTLYSSVFLPNGTVDEYETTIQQADQALKEVSRRCRSELSGYR